MLLGRKGMQSGAPIFVRIFKEESELEVENSRLKRMYSDLSLENDALKELITKKL